MTNNDDDPPSSPPPPPQAIIYFTFSAIQCCDASKAKKLPRFSLFSCLFSVEESCSTMIN